MTRTPSQVGSGAHSAGDLPRITRAAREDAFALAALKLQMDREFDLAPRPGFIDEFADTFLRQFDQLPTWIAKTADGAPVGFVQCSLVHRVPSLARAGTPNLHLGVLFTSATVRGVGLGERLVREAVAYARNSGAGRITINAFPAAAALYRRVGFAPPQEGWLEIVLTSPADATFR